MSSKNKPRNNQNPMASNESISDAISSEDKVVAPVDTTPVDNEEKVATVAETVVETPKEETPVTPETPKEEKKEEPVVETPKKEEKKPEEKKPEEKKPVDKKKKAIDITTDIEVRYAATFSNKRIATIRKMPLYTIIYTYIHNRSAFLGLVYASQFDEIFNYILSNPITIEGVKMSDQLKKDFYLKIKSDTDYVKIKWGNK